LRYVCKDCSRKRVIDGKENHRVSDGQFCLARVDDAQEAADEVAQEWLTPRRLVNRSESLFSLSGVS
jgi:uncharacterized protein YggL (DUF469 family)